MAELRMSTIPELEEKLAKMEARLQFLSETFIYIGPTPAESFFGSKEVS